jgi:hypothetical protein
VAFFSPFSNTTAYFLVDNANLICYSLNQGV